MKLNRLVIDNIRSHIHSEIPLERLTICKAANHAGKSTIAQALEFAFAGRSDVTDKGVLADLLRWGQDKGAVAVEFEPAPNAKRILRASLTRVSGRDVGMRNPSDPAWNGAPGLGQLAKDRDVLSCLTNTSYFVSQKPNRQREILAGLILPQQYDFDLPMRSLSDEAGLVVNWALAPFVVIESVYDQAFKARTNVNRDLKNFRLPEVPEIDEKYKDPEEVRNQLRLLRDKREDVSGKRSAIVHAYEMAAQKRTSLAALIDGLSLQVGKEQATADDLRKAAPSKAKLEELKKVAGQAKQARLLDDELLLIGSDLAQIDKAIKALDDLGEQSQCPTCEQSIRTEHLTSVMRPLIDRKTKLLQSQREKGDQRKALGDYEGAEKKLEDNKRDEKDLKTVVARIANLDRELAGAKEDLAKTAVAAKPDTTELDEEIAVIDKRMDTGLNILSQSTAHQTLTKAKEKAVADRELLTAQQSRLEQLCEYFGPSANGIKAKLIAENVGGFTDTLNHHLEQWGYTAALSIEPYGFTVTTSHDGQKVMTRQLHQLSKSELYRFSVAFQIALALITSYRFAVIDESDILDASSGKELMRTLFRSDLEQAIVLATDSAAPVTNGAPGCIWIQLTEEDDHTEVEVVRHNVAVQEEVSA